MDRRTLLALLLTAIVIVVTPMLFPSPKPAARRTSDSTALATSDTSTRRTTDTGAPAAPPTVTAPGVRSTPAPQPSAAPQMVADTTAVNAGHATYLIATPGATPVNVKLPDYTSLRPGIAANTPVHLLDPGDRLLRLSLVGVRDTIALDTVNFRADPLRGDGAAVVQSFSSTSSAVPITITYTFPADSFVAHVRGSVGGAAASDAWRLLITLPSRIRSDEANVQEDVRHLSVAYKPRGDDVASVGFGQLDPAEARIDTGAIRWVAERNKYFLVAVVPERSGPDSLIQALSLRGAPRTGKQATDIHATAVLPATGGRFAFTLYAGPQSWDHLRRTAPDLENVNPYGGWLHGVVQPFSAIVMRMLLWMRHTLDVSYGWVLVIFGVAIRIVLWPLYQSSMRSSLKMQRLQPELAEIQKKYRSDPEKQRDAMMKLYKQHDMSPFSPMLGCLPMLLPMPILFALYFALTNTIELRGVPFLWLPDLSLKDPTYIIPLFLGISMFLTSWIGMRGMPPSPQSKTMAYVMPVMFTVIFWNFASGVNLYYAVQNVAALPQQWVLARERSSQSAGRPADGARTGKGGGGGARGT